MKSDQVPMHQRSRTAPRDDRRAARLRVLAAAGLAMLSSVGFSCPPTPMVPIPPPGTVGQAPKVTLSNIANGPASVDKSGVDSTMPPPLTATVSGCPGTVTIWAGASSPDGVAELDLAITGPGTTWNVANKISPTQVTPDGGGILLELPTQVSILGASSASCGSTSTPCGTGGTAINVTCTAPNASFNIVVTGIAAGSSGSGAGVTTLTETLKCGC